MATYNIDERRTIPTISWSAVFAGGITALAIAILLNLLGLGLGFAAIDPLTETNPLSGLGTGAIIWWGVSNLIALFAGGMVAGRMAGYVSKTDGGLHGFLSWCLYAAVSVFFLVTTVGSIIAGVTGTVSSIFSGDNQRQKIVVQVNNQQQQQQDQPLSLSNMRDEALDLIEKAERYNILPDDASENVNQAINEATADLNQTWQELNIDRNIDEFFNDLSVEFDDNGNLDVSVEGDYLDKEGMKNYLVQNTDLSEQEIEQTVDEWNESIDQAITTVENIYQDAKQKLEKYSDQLADGLATFSLIAFVVFILGAIASFAGGMATARSNPALVEDDYNRRREETMNPS